MASPERAKTFAGLTAGNAEVPSPVRTCQERRGRKGKPSRCSDQNSCLYLCFTTNLAFSHLDRSQACDLNHQLSHARLDPAASNARDAATKVELVFLRRRPAASAVVLAFVYVQIIQNGASKRSRITPLRKYRKNPRTKDKRATVGPLWK